MAVSKPVAGAQRGLFLDELCCDNIPPEADRFRFRARVPLGGLSSSPTCRGPGAGKLAGFLYVPAAWPPPRRSREMTPHRTPTHGVIGSWRARVSIVSSGDNECHKISHVIADAGHESRRLRELFSSGGELYGAPTHRQLLFPPLLPGRRIQIGRASCRERV